VNSRDDIDCVLLSVWVLVVQDFSEEFLPSVGLDQIVLVAVQTLLADLDVARHSKDKLLQTLPNSILHNSVVFSVHTDALDYRNVKDLKAGLYRQLLQRKSYDFQLLPVC